MKQTDLQKRTEELEKENRETGINVRSLENDLYKHAQDMSKLLLCERVPASWGDIKKEISELHGRRMGCRRSCQRTIPGRVNGKLS